LTALQAAASVAGMNQALAALLLVLPAHAAADAPAKPPPVAEVYKTHCQSCHMADGDSPLEPLNFVDAFWKHGSTPAKVAAVIADGVPGSAMLAFKDKLTAAQVRALAAYVRAFDKKLKPAARRKKK
jgi:mono/diheme cytochrome c family protein